MPRPRKAISETDQGPEYRYTVKDMPAGERPRERLLEHGPGALSNAELLAIILRTGTAGQPVTEMASALLSRFQRLDDLQKASTKELCDQVSGLGPAKVTQIKAALELGRRLQAEAAPDRSYSVRSPENVAELLRLDLEREDQENLKVVLLDTRHRVVGSPTVYKGSVNSAVVRMAELFREATRQNCPSLILAHNHPSGDPSPSPEDIQLTTQAIEAGRQLDIKVLDHIIIGRGSFKSLRRDRPSLPWPE